MKTTVRLVMAVLTGLVLTWPGLAAAVTDADKCEAAKLKVAGKYGFCRLKAEAKAAQTGDAPDYSKCDAKFSQKWTDAETKGGGTCPTSGDEAVMQSFVSGHSLRIASVLSGQGTIGDPPLKTGQTQCDQGAGTLGACPGLPSGQDGALQKGTARSYTDNGDGTITDNVTGLMWEKLSDDGSIHNFHTYYTWYNWIVKVANLNTAPCFAGHCDWRLPNINELQTLADYSRESPAIDPVFNTACVPGCTVSTCSCTQSFGYWSSTTYNTYAGNLYYAWTLEYNSGTVWARDKSTNDRCVRAVRGGL
ncbi:MAG: hypothetical protein UX68_C0005G0004 [Parcubacteria group bacterium GW2011_GWA2_46_9]|nr:MAG: hypothetical protein UX68_C0005G0004 [Parcubacteria group bacterium GW2011_GWA2_46_9]